MLVGLSVVGDRGVSGHGRDGGRDGRRAGLIHSYAFQCVKCAKEQI